MIEVRIPVSDVNSRSAVIVAWHAADLAAVAAGDLICEAETTKAVVEVRAPVAGILRRLTTTDARVDLADPVAVVAPDLAAARAFSPAAADATSGIGATATRAAIALAGQLGVDLAGIAADGLVTAAMVAEAARSGSRPDLLDPLVAPPGARRVVIVGAGLGATQVADILDHHDDLAPIAVLDDDPGRWGAEVAGLPVVGGVQRVAELSGAFDAAIIAISSSVGARAALRARLQSVGLPLVSAIDPTVRVARGATVGDGCVICAFSHLGVESRVGANTFLSAYTSIDHHSVVGADCSGGPGCMTSGCVTIGDRVRLGTGIFVQPLVTIGDDAMIASGAIVTEHVPAGYAVKTRIAATVIVAPRRAA